MAAYSEGLCFKPIFNSLAKKIEILLPISVVTAFGSEVDVFFMSSRLMKISG